MLETLADIAYYAGEQKYHSGDSRTDISEFIYWAFQFEKEHSETDWDAVDYILKIKKFAINELTNR